MMMGIFGSLVTAFMLLSSGANHLLDYAATEPYWESKEVNVSLETMIAELKVPAAEDVGQLIRQLGSPDPAMREAARQGIQRVGPAVIPQLEAAAASPDPEIAASSRALADELRVKGKAAAVRRLMAIRTLGELKKPEAIVHLKPLLDSKEMFVGEYARRAIARIEGKPYTGPAATAEQRMEDVWLLPAGMRAVAQLQARSTDQTLTTLLAGVPDLNKHLAAMTLPDRPTIIEGVTREIIKIAEHIGDVRIDNITLGVTGDANDEKGAAVIIVRGLYDAHAVAAAIRSLGAESKLVEGVEVFDVDDQAMIAASDHRFLIMGAAEPEQLGIEAAVKALAAGKGGLRDDKEMAPVMQAASTKDPCWLAMKMTDDLREQTEVLAPFDTVTIGTAWREDILQIFMTCKGTDAEKVKAAADEMEGEIKEAIENSRETVQEMPGLQPLVDTLASIKVAVTGASAVITASAKRDPALLLMLPMAMGGIHHEGGMEGMIEPAEGEIVEIEDAVVPQVVEPVDP